MPLSLRKRWDWERKTERATTLDELLRYLNVAMPILSQVANAPDQGSVRTVTAAHTVTREDEVVLADAAGGAFSVTLPLARDFPRQRKSIKRLNSGANAVTIARSGSDTLDGGTSISLSAQYAFRTLISDGAVWHVIGTG
jgi:hypothetical protein